MTLRQPDPVQAVVLGRPHHAERVVQRLLLVAAIGWAAATTTRLFGVRAGWIAIIGGGLFLYAKGGRWTEVLLSEPLFMPLLVGWTALLVKV